MSVLLIGAIVASFLIAIAALTLGLRSRGERVRQWLAAFLVFGALWSLIVNLQGLQEDPTFNVWVVRLTFVAALVMIYCMLRFTYTVSGRRMRKPFSFAVYAVTGALIFMTLVGWVIPTVEIINDVVVPERLPTYYLIALFIIGVAFYSLVLLYISRRRTRDQATKKRLQIIMIGLGGGIVLGISTNIILPNIVGSILPARYGWIAILLWTVVLVYAVIRHKFIDIRLAVVRTVAYFLILATMAGIYFALAFAISIVIQGSFTNIVEIIINLALALVLALLFQPLKYYFDRLTNSIFYRDNYSTDEFFARMSRELGATSDLRELLDRAAREIRNTIKIESTLFYIRYGMNRSVNVGEGRYNKLLAEDIKILDEYVSKAGSGIIIVDDLKAGALRRSLLGYKISLVLPFLRDGRIFGYLLLGHQQSRDYTRRDIRALETISDELVIAIQNALSVQEVKEINDTLQQRIQDATKELRATNEQLQKLDTAKDEFVSMASHQLRTPLTSVKGYISMVLEGDVGKITPMQRQLLSEAFTSSERMVHLIGDFLNVSRLQTGKFILEKKPVDLAKLMSQEIDSLETTIEAHGLKLSYHKPSYFPVLMLDEGKIRQVLMNFIDNAIFYSQEGGKITVKLSVEEGFAVARVIDAGIGVPKSERAHLFTKFFRASNARKQRPDGTGVGLFLAKKVITAHGGTMVFESEEGKGSTFGFRLPIKKLQAPTKK